MLGVGALGSWAWWKLAMRKAIIGLVARREAIAAGRRALEDVVSELAEGSDERMMAFATDSGSENRRSLDDVYHRMTMVADELEVRAVPALMVGTADALGHAARAIADEAAKVERVEPDEVLEGLAAIDLAAVSTALEDADEVLRAVSEVYGVEEAAVYGGGLYI